MITKIKEFLKGYDGSVGDYPMATRLGFGPRSIMGDTYGPGGVYRTFKFVLKNLDFEQIGEQQLQLLLGWELSKCREQLNGKSFNTNDLFELALTLYKDESQPTNVHYRTYEIIKHLNCLSKEHRLMNSLLDTYVKVSGLTTSNAIVDMLELEDELVEHPRF